MTVDVIIPVRNGERFIAECLDSVLRQTAEAKISRIIVIDDGSVDSTSQIVENYIRVNSKVELYSTAPNGLSAARNFGIKSATAQNITFLDSDDIWLEHKIDLHLAHLSQHPNCQFSFAPAYEFTKDPNLSRLQGRNTVLPSFSSILLQQFRIFGSGSSVFVNREAALSAGGFDETIKYGEDWDCWLALSLLQLPCELSKPSTLIRIHSSSMQRSEKTGGERFLNSYIHFQEWTKYPWIVQDNRFQAVAIQVLWAEIRKNLSVGFFMSPDYCNFLFENYSDLVHNIGFRKNRFFILQVLFRRIKLGLS